MGLWQGIKRGTKALFSEHLEEYEAGGKRIQCRHCGTRRFVEGSAQLNTVGMSFANLDWANKSATTLMCSHCGLIHWFGKAPQRVP